MGAGENGRRGAGPSESAPAGAAGRPSSGAAGGAPAGRACAAAFVVGLACYWPAVFAHPYLTLIALLPADDSAGLAARLDVLLPLSILVWLAMLGLAASARARRAPAGASPDRAQRPPRAKGALPFALMGAAGCAGYALMAAGGAAAGAARPALIVVGVALVGAYLCAATLGWGAATAARGPRLVGETALSFLVYNALDILVGLTAVPVFFLQPAFALVSACCLRLLAVRQGGRGPCARSAASPGPGGLRASLARVPWLIFAPCAVLVTLNSVLNKAVFFDSPEGSGDLRFITTIVVFVLMGALLAYGLRRPCTQNSLFSAFIVFLVLYMVTIFLILALDGVQQGVHRVWLGMGISLKAYAWAVLGFFAWQRRQGAAAPFGAYLVLMVALSFAVSLSADPADGVVGPLVGMENAALVGEFALLVVAVVSVVAVSLGLSANLRRASAPGAPSRDERARAMLERGGLTERELDVAVLVSRGYSARRVGEALSLSEHTVNNHLARAYRKLGIHSRQELMDLVEEGLEARTE